MFCVFEDFGDLYRIKEISNGCVQRKVTQKRRGRKIMQIPQVANSKVKRCRRERPLAKEVNI